MTDDDPLLAARDVRKHFGGLKAVDGMDVTVDRGEIVGLIGPNGAGKTTFFNCLSGALDLTDGIVRFDGDAIQDLPPYKIARRGLVRTFQLTRALARLTVRENLLLAPKGQVGERVWAPLLPVGGRPRIRRQEQTNQEAAEELLDVFDLDHVADEYAGALSGGQRKLLELARALMLDPEMLLLDEPVAGVNPSLTDRIMDRVQHVREERDLTILLIEHDMETVMEHCERVVVMAEGRKLAEGTPEAIQDDPEVIDAYLGGG